MAMCSDEENNCPFLSLSDVLQARLRLLYYTHLLLCLNGSLNREGDPKELSTVLITALETGEIGSPRPRQQFIYDLSYYLVIPV